MAGRGPLGIDLELVEPRSDAFVDDYFTADESAYVRSLTAGAARDEAANLIWSAKEAALKVRQVGLRADTREVAVDLGHVRGRDGWTPLSVTGRDGASFPGWWRRDGVFLLTIAGRQPSPPPHAPFRRRRSGSCRAVAFLAGTAAGLNPVRAQPQRAMPRSSASTT